jgi:peptidoglycan/LPS O-acetylase OafA/YrhL
MPGSERAEIYFIAAMMVLTLILSGASVYFFVRQYKKEMREKELRRARKDAKRAAGNHHAAP